MTIAEKVDQAIGLDRELKEKKKVLDGLKAELQAEALYIMENRNIKWQQIAGSAGFCNVGYKEKFEIDSFALLEELFDDLALSKVVIKQEVKYEVADDFKKALIALYKADYKQHDLPDLLSQMGMEDKKIKAAVKKLKGDYLKDKAVLESMGITGDLEEELDAIHEQKNHELVSRFFEADKVDMAKLKRAIYVEDGLSIGLEAIG